MSMLSPGPVPGGRAAGPGQPAPAVSIMMPAYNAEAFVEEAIRSAIAQTYADWELIVVDDGSTDRTGAIASSVGDPRIRVIRQENRGEAGARNTALRLARGAALAFLDADDVFLPHHLEVTIGHLREHRGHAGVYTDGYYITEAGRRLKRLSERRRGPVTGRVLPDVIRGCEILAPPLCLVLRLEPIRGLDLRFDETIGLGTDWDFIRRFAEVGQFGYLDRPTCLYRLHGSNMTMTMARPRQLQGFAACRIKAVKAPSFATCPLDVRLEAFYDLLLVALSGEPARQQEVFDWPEFRGLPGREQARLIRLCASAAIIGGDRPGLARAWLRRVRHLSRGDWRAAAVGTLHRLSPALCRHVLRARRITQAGMAHPYADLLAELRGVEEHAGAGR